MGEELIGRALSLCREDLLKQVPDKEGVYVKVPKISTEADA
jgi:Asp-tRNA(Asn)/Glu-tRNA(Gln) amidotransferase C subunit